MATQKTVTGSCMCGATRFAIVLPTLFCGHCHCTMCRRSHGAGFVTWFAVPNEQFALETGEAELVRFQSSDHGTRTFCGCCGSTLFCQSTRQPGHIDIVLANMDTSIDRKPEFHFYFDDRAEWSFVDDGLPRLGGPSGTAPLTASGESD